MASYCAEPCRPYHDSMTNRFAVLGILLTVTACAGDPGAATEPTDDMDAVSGKALASEASGGAASCPEPVETYCPACATCPSPTVPRCVPGTQSACQCTDGSSGAQVCQDDGTMGVCECEAPGIVVPAVPDGYSGKCAKAGWSNVANGLCPQDQPWLYVNCPGKPDYNTGLGCLNATNPGNGMWCCRT